MGCSYAVLTDILVPLIAAMIGGGLTLVGVIFTIKHGDKARKDDHEWEMKIHAKPILINFPPEQYSIAHATTFLFSPSGDCSKVAMLTALVKNTDNGIAFLDKISTHNVTYYPDKDSTMDKGSVAFIQFYLADKKEDLQEIVLHLHDLYGNLYYYPLEQVHSVQAGSKHVNLSVSAIHEL